MSPEKARGIGPSLPGLARMHDVASIPQPAAECRLRPFSAKVSKKFRGKRHIVHVYYFAHE